MSFNNGLLTVLLATIICAIISYFLYRKYREGKMIIYHILFCAGVYLWLVRHFFPIPIIFSKWAAAELKYVDNYDLSYILNLIPFSDVYDLIKRFGFNEITKEVLLKEYVYIAWAPLLMGFSIKGAYVRLNTKLRALTVSLIGALTPFLVHSAIIVFSGRLWNRADITYSLLFLLYFWFGYGINSFIKKLW